ncbi:MAG: response regulator [Planctomycetota bacterium]|jgi:DNA-binding NarL/FixJ family response regulator
MKTIRVLSVDDHAFLGEGLKTRLEVEADIEFVGWIESADTLVASVREHEADVVLLDIEMPGRDPFDAVRDLKSASENTKVIFLSAYIRDTYLDEALQAGAWGYLGKSDEPDAVVAAIRQVMNDEFAFGPKVLESCRPEGTAERPTTKLDLLTERERQVLRLIGQGLSRNDIATSIHRSPKTVDNHRASIMTKLDIHDRVELARYAIAEGIAEV